jgi:hypothetical protein
MALFLAFLAPVLATLGCAAIAWQLIAASRPVRDFGQDRATAGDRRPRVTASHPPFSANPPALAPTLRQQLGPLLVLAGQRLPGVPAATQGATTEPLNPTVGGELSAIV